MTKFKSGVLTGWKIFVVNSSEFSGDYVIRQKMLQRNNNYCIAAFNRGSINND